MASVPYAALAEALEPALAVLDDSGTNLPDVWLRELGRLLPDVFVHRPDLYPPLPMDSGDDRLRLFQAVARFLNQLPQPVLLCMDDLQWADPLTVSLLEYLLRQPPGQLRLATVAAVRDGSDSEAVQRTISSLARLGRLTRVALGHLTKDDTVALVRHLSPPGVAADPDHVYSQTQGHPLYTVELVAMLRDGAGGTNDVLVPPTMQNLVLDRLERLGQPAAAVADTLAVFGREARLDQLVRITHLPDGEVVGALGKLGQAGVTAETAEGHVGFRHDVFRQVVLERMPATRRTYLHRQAYAALLDDLPETAGGNAETPSQDGNLQLLASLVAHAVGGQLWIPALSWARRAAAVAERLYAFAAAVDYLNTARYCLAQLPPSDAHHRELLEIEALLVRLDRRSSPEERDRRLREAARLALETGAVAFLPRIQMAQVDSLMRQGRCLEAAELLQQLAPLASRDPRLALAYHAWQGAVHALTGDVQSAIHHFIQVRDAMGKEVLKPGTSVNGGLAACYAAAGQFADADAALAAMKQEEAAQGYQSLTSKYLSVAATVEYRQLARSRQPGEKRPDRGPGCGGPRQRGYLRAMAGSRHPWAHERGAPVPLPPCRPRRPAIPHPLAGHERRFDAGIRAKRAWPGRKRRLPRPGPGVRRRLRPRLGSPQVSAPRPGDGGDHDPRGQAPDAVRPQDKGFHAGQVEGKQSPGQGQHKAHLRHRGPRAPPLPEERNGHAAVHEGAEQRHGDPKHLGIGARVDGDAVAHRAADEGQCPHLGPPEIARQRRTGGAQSREPKRPAWAPRRLSGWLLRAPGR